MNLKTSVLLLLLAASNTFISAQVSLPKIIGSNMILQREKPLPVWGWAKAGEAVTVSFAGQQKATKADVSGYWEVILSPLKANAKPQEMTISASNVIKLSNLLIGEVWLASGQSNMEYPMNRTLYKYAKPGRGIDSAETELKNSYPTIRIFLVEKKLSTPDVTSNGWNEASGETLERFSAAGFYFAKNIQKDLNVPIGIISSSWGGSRIEPWTPAEAYKSLPVFAADVKANPAVMDGSPVARNYTSMILPLAPFALRGFLWYQGESNLMVHDGMKYADKMQALVEGWRKQWGDNKLPFYYVQIAPYYYTKRKDKLAHTSETLAELWEAQTQSLKISETGMAVTTDLVDNLADIHPSYKWEVGRRLALLALDKTYDKNVVSSGPVFKKMKVKGNTALLSFSNDVGLKSSDGKELTWFTVAGSDGKFVPATAKVVGETVYVSAPGVSKPVNVRFAWNETAMPNLVNAAGLPAVPFRSNGLQWSYKK
ncbi:MAG: sialate O-acetylesterase [Sphingobacteriaceae bacterium]|nr:sialate O-acetylesterase [Sphingobacteriaceae bacterium]